MIFTAKKAQKFFLLEKFKTIQQTTDYTCGPVCYQMVLNYFGNYNYSEMQLKDIMQTKPEQIYHNIYKNKILFLKTHIDIWFLF